MKNTLILPVDDSDLAARMLQQMIQDFTVILMIVFGGDAKATRVAEVADQLAERGFINGRNSRHVVWIRNTADEKVKAVLAPIMGNTDEVLVTVLNFSDEVRATIPASDSPNVPALESAFLQGED